MSDAVRLMGGLGYDRPARPVDVDGLKLPDLERATVIRSGSTKRTGYGILIGETHGLPRSLRPLARAVQREVHDSPLAVIGGSANGSGWDRMVIFRPRQVGGQLGAVTVSRLDVDLSHPTGHDAEVVSSLRWRSDLPDIEAQKALTAALNVEEVAARFYKGLRPHFEALERAVDASSARSGARAEAIAAAGGTR